jgi:hypothetical protein
VQGAEIKTFKIKKFSAIIGGASNCHPAAPPKEKKVFQGRRKSALPSRLKSFP